MDEFNEMALFSGFAGLTDEQLVGFGITNNPAAFRKAAIGRAKATVPQPNNSRGAFMTRVGKLPGNVQRGLASQALQGADTAFMLVKSISQVTTVKMLQDSDVKTPGFCMINAGKLEKDEDMVLTAIQLLYGVSGSSAAVTTAALAAASTWTPILDLHALGQFELKVGNKTLIPNHSMRVFKKDFFQVSTSTTPINVGLSAGVATGLHVFDNPKHIPSQTSIELNIELGSAAAQYSAFMLVLYGTRAYKN